ncbi:Tyrosine-protein phosphatase YwqE [[Clostridium] ultunense Esp]|nr:Tyrosine-protein phosphatase YwqE [[Clostridium] ultunense Esp]
MIDLHTHILPDLDDGAKGEEEFLAMARLAVQDGITRIVATPHHQNGTYLNPRHKVEKETAWANEILRSKGIPLEIYPGQEIRIYEGLLQDLANGDLLPLDPRSHYLLLELPSQSVPHYMEKLIYEILMLGITPVIPHPERNMAIRRQPLLLYRMVKAGAIIQVTAGSLLGHFGKETQRFTQDLFRHSLAHLVASDAHQAAGPRIPALSGAYRMLRVWEGDLFAREIQDNAEKVAAGESIPVNEPEKIERRRHFIFF